MRHFFILFAAAFLLSCSEETPVKNSAPGSMASRPGDVPPLNSDNPYENAGALFSTLFDAYYNGTSLPSTPLAISQRVETLASQNANFNALKPANYAAPSLSRMTFINDHPTTCVQDVVSGLQLTSNAKTSLIGFINDLVNLCNYETDYNVIYSYIVNYEAAVQANNGFTAHDKQVILCTTSISRYSSYKPRRKPKKNTDPEWKYLVTHVTGGSDGADTSVAQSITESLTTGIIENN